MTNCHALIQRLTDELQRYMDWAPNGPCDEEQALVDEARAFLSQFKPVAPTLKKQALEQLSGIATAFRVTCCGDIVCDKIIRAIEALPND